MKNNEIRNRMSELSTMMADIEDPSLLMEGMDLSEEDVKTYLLGEFHNYLWAEFQSLDTELIELRDKYQDLISFFATTT